MFAMTSKLPRYAARAAVVLGTTLLVAACGTQSSPPQQVRTDNPSVTYKYLGDQELISANQKAVVYCNQFHSVPSTKVISETSDGLKQVVFDCVPTTTPGLMPAPTYSPTTSYTYRTDQELLTGSRNAEIYCMNQGNQRAVSTVMTNPDGTKTLSSRCVP